MRTNCTYKYHSMYSSMSCPKCGNCEVPIRCQPKLSVLKTQKRTPERKIVDATKKLFSSLVDLYNALVEYCWT